MKPFLLALLSFAFYGVVAQTTVSGNIADEEGNPVAGATITIVNSGGGAISDSDGYFQFTTEEVPPFSLRVSSLGYADETLSVIEDNQTFTVQLAEEFNQLQQIVVSASRTPERVFESPVSIERIGVQDIQETTAPDFYSSLENLKGVDLNTNSLTFKSINTRGFATFANNRFVQLVDGMDNTSPALNFVLGNLIGMNDLDVQSVEILPGASSALYGANAFNGILFMTSKSPFDKDGVSAYAKSGFTSSGDNNYYGDFGVRLAEKFSDKFAAKVNFSYLTGTEWPAQDFNDYETGASSRQDPGYDGLNVYGDEVSTTLNFDALAMTPAGTLGSANISRTGYSERDLIDQDVTTWKGDVALHFKPNADDLEFIYNGKLGKGNFIYQGANRYSVKDFTMQQHKLEARADNFFVRGYLTTEDAGDSYDSRFTAININRAWKSDQQWFTDYATGYIGAFTGMIPGVTPGDATIAHATARANADAGRLIPGTSQFDNAFNTITADPDLLTGSRFVDNSTIYHADANYNFKNQIDWADIQIGGSWRQYSLDSEGTIYTDTDGPINYNEYGVYTQLQKKFADDKLKFTGSLRYDGAELFDGNVSPRVSMVFSPDEEKRHNIRASFQTGFRYPTTQDLYIGLDAGRAILVGSAEDNLDRYVSRPIPNSLTAQQLGFPATSQLTGRNAYENAYTLGSLLAFGAAAAQGNIDPTLLQIATPNLVEPEKIQAYELGYRAAFGRNTFFDISGYYNAYENFLANETVVAPNYGNVDFSDITALPPQLGGPTPTALIAIGNEDFTAFQTYTNSDAEVNSYGMNMGIDTRFGSGFDAGFNYTYAKLDFDQAANPGFETNFNTPEHKVKANFGNPELFNNFGFNLNYRWNDVYTWQSSFVDATIPARSIVDAQLSYTVDSMDSVFKLGAQNLLNYEYESAPGAGTLGGLYFLSWTYNN